jgi:SPP1 family predicted phage head-tail adaptor
MNIGEFRYTIVVVQPQTVRDSYGAESVTYTTAYTLKASVKYVGGAKNINNNEIFNSNNVVFETHYRGITDDMIILFNNQKYSINYIAEIGYKAGLSITAEKINE